jgi:hypothetical protein
MDVIKVTVNVSEDVPQVTMGLNVHRFVGTAPPDVSKLTGCAMEYVLRVTMERNVEPAVLSVITDVHSIMVSATLEAASCTAGERNVHHTVDVLTGVTRLPVHVLAAGV